MKEPMKMKNIWHHITFIIFSLVIIMCIASCGGGDSDYVPKPKGYFRIDLPKKQYVLFDSTCPYTFEYPVYAKVVPDNDRKAEPYWINLDFPKFKGRVNISYKLVRQNLAKYAEDAYILAMKHIPKATNIDDERIDIGEHKVYGIIYNIEGEGAASTYQFFVTDSLSNFVRGALYFNLRPNNDSLSPVIEFIKEDIRHLIKTFRWKKV
jgi:gliding motility-associated lipoprotein GldD